MRLSQWTNATPTGVTQLWPADQDVPIGWAPSSITAPDASVVYIVRLAASDPVFARQMSDAKTATVAKQSLDAQK